MLIDSSKCVLQLYLLQWQTLCFAVVYELSEDLLFGSNLFKVHD